MYTKSFHRRQNTWIVNEIDIIESFQHGRRGFDLTSCLIVECLTKVSSQDRLNPAFWLIEKIILINPFQYS